MPQKQAPKPIAVYNDSLISPYILEVVDELRFFKYQSVKRSGCGT